MSDNEGFACLAAVGDDRVGLVRDVTALLVDLGVNIGSIRSATLGAEFALLAHFGGTPEQLRAVEAATASLQRQTELSVLFHRSKQVDRREPAHAITHDLFVSAYDTVGIVSELARALALRNVNIERLGGDQYPAPNQGLPLFTVVASLHLPAVVDEAAVRADLEALRARHGWADADLQPHGRYDVSALADAPGFPPRHRWSEHETP